MNNSNVIIEEVPFNRLQENSLLFDKVLHLDSQMGPVAWTTQGWSTQVNSSQREFLFFVAKFREEVLGFCLYEINSLMEQAHLLKIVVEKKSRQKGVGRELMNISLNKIDEMTGISKKILEVSTKNHSAVHLYEKLGFKTIHCQKKFYSSGEDAWIMQA